MNQVAVLRWQIARGQCDAIPNRLSLRERRDYWAFRLYEASDELARADAEGRGVMVGELDSLDRLECWIDEHWMDAEGSYGWVLLRYGMPYLLGQGARRVWSWLKR